MYIPPTTTQLYVHRIISIAGNGKQTVLAGFRCPIKSLFEFSQIIPTDS